MYVSIWETETRNVERREVVDQFVVREREKRLDPYYRDPYYSRGLSLSLSKTQIKVVPKCHRALQTTRKPSRPTSRVICNCAGWAMR